MDCDNTDNAKIKDLISGLLRKEPVGREVSPFSKVLLESWVPGGPRLETLWIRLIGQSSSSRSQ